MEKAREIMFNEFIYCAPTSHVNVPKLLMQKYNCTKIPVIDKNKMIIGSVSAVDLCEVRSDKVVECMAKTMCAVEEDDTVDECLRLMILNNIDLVAVINKQGQYRGLITEKTIVEKTALKKIFRGMVDAS